MSEPLSAFVAARQDAWTELGGLVEGSRGSVRRLDAERVRHLGRLYRQAVADLAYARRAYPKDPVTTRLEVLVGRARPVLYGTVRERRSLVHFVTTGYWQRVRERPAFLAAAAIVLLVPTLAMGAWAHANPAAAERVAQASPLTANLADGGKPRDPDTQKVTGAGKNAGLSGEIFTNNVQVALATFAGGLTAGVFTIISLLFNGLLLGLLSGLLIREGYSDTLWRLIVPHGILELSLITASATAGLRLAWAMVHPGHRTRTASMVAEARGGIELALGSCLLLVPCGIVEGSVTIRGLPTPAALSVGIGLGVAYWGLVAWRGRPDPVTAEPTP